jgi:signal transduction histidine kinase
MFKKLWSYIVLPSEITAFEQTYLKKMNRVALIFFYLHIPVFAGVAALCGTGPLKALLMTSGMLLGPTIAYFAFSNVRIMSAVFGFTAMCLGGLLVHFGQGPMQIEMHFYFFVLLALLAVFGNPTSILVAAGTVALHHLLLYLLLPESVFNYEASFWAVLIHALFVVLESIAACFVARSFFDNVIGLERIVAERTRDLDSRNEDMHLVLDNVGQGFFTIDRKGQVSRERSTVVGQWLGDPPASGAFWDYLGQNDAQLGEWFQLGFESVLEDVLPIELSIEQLPKRTQIGQRHLRFEYRPIMVRERFEKLLVVISDATHVVEVERLEAQQRETHVLFERIMRDRAGVVELLSEGLELQKQLKSSTDLASKKRALHTLKGNASIFGMHVFANYCHQVETQIAEEGDLADKYVEELQHRWDAVSARVHTLLGGSLGSKLEIDEAEYQAVLEAAKRNDTSSIVGMLSTWKLEPTEKRLVRIADQARSIAERQRKPIEVRMSSNQLRLESNVWVPFWSSFIHLVRNAVDHGLEDSEERIRAKKAPVGTLELKTFRENDAIIVEVRDDGRGVDWDAVKRRAKELGLPCATQEDLTELLFADGFSTRSQVSDLSGRGVGMSSVRRACEARGGQISVHSERGRGTTLQCRFPSA